MKRRAAALAVLASLLATACEKPEESGKGTTETIPYVPPSSSPVYIPPAKPPEYIPPAKPPQYIPESGEPQDVPLGEPTTPPPTPR